MCTTIEKQVGSYTKITAPFHGENLQELCGDHKFVKYLLP